MAGATQPPNKLLHLTGAASSVLRGYLSGRRPRQVSFGVRQQEGFALDTPIDGVGFDPRDWGRRLAQRLRLEIFNAHRKVGIDSIRAFAIDCYPWHGNVLCISFLTDREWPDLDEQGGKWDIASWRLYAFPSAPHCQWPYGEDVLREAQRYYDAADSPEEAAKRRDVILRSCIEALNDSLVQKELQRYELTPDFEIYVGHADAPGRNYYKEWGGAGQR